MNPKDLSFEFNKILLDPAFGETIKEVGAMGFSLPDYSHVQYLPEEMLFSSGELVNSVGSIERTALRAQQQIEQTYLGRSIIAYDESIAKFASLEGTAYSTSHSLVLLGSSSYVPVNYLTFYFYTRSEEIVRVSNHIKLSEDPEIDSKKDYIRDRIRFLETMAPENSILLIDGPLIGGDVYTIMMRSIKVFHKKNIIPVFFVKNSSSNLVTDNVAALRKKYNSDLHWSYKFLRRGERTNFFIYRDKVNPENAKAFCYLKAFDLSPQRVEFHLETYSRYTSLIADLMDLVYYLLLVQGSKTNPQVRPIAIAERYARETLNLVDIFSLMREAGISPTMNQVRFGG